MKKLILLVLLSIGLMTANAQTKAPVVNTTVEANGNYKEKTDAITGKIYTSKDGKKSQVYITSKGKLYIITGISKKTGKPTKKYLII